MKLSDLLRFSVDNLRRRKGRTVLTVIGVVVGVCAIVLMVSLGIAVNQATDAMLKNWGDLTKIEVQNYGSGDASVPALDDKMVESFRKIPNVIAATPIYSDYSLNGITVEGNNGRYQSTARIIGVDPDAVQPMGYSLLTGNYNISQRMGKDKIPVLVESMVPFTFYDSKRRQGTPGYQKEAQYNADYTAIGNLPSYDAAGKLLNPDEFFFDVMGAKLTYRLQYGTDENGAALYKEYELVPVGMFKTQTTDFEVGNSFMMSLENMKKIEADYKKLSRQSGGDSIGSSSGQHAGYDSVYIKVDSVDNMSDVEKQVKSVGYSIMSMSEQRAQMQAQVAQTQGMLGGLAAISLLVAALNIMNTMTMAIYERTKEIGVMKVLGCKISNIRHMFLIEAGTIGLVGGIAGVVISEILSLLLNHLPDILSALGLSSSVDIAAIFGLGGYGSSMQGGQLSVIPVWLILLALGFSTIIGVVSGIGPSNRAVKISSLEAIRHE